MGSLSVCSMQLQTVLQMDCFPQERIEREHHCVAEQFLALLRFSGDDQIFEHLHNANCTQSCP